MMQKTRRENYKWYIMILSALTNAFVIAVPSMGLSVLLPEIAKDLHLSLFQSGLLWGISSLPSILTSLFAGSLCDRFGPRRILIVNCLLVGSASALRGLSENFVFLVFSVFLFGFFAPMITISNFMNALKWFPAGERGVANGLATLGMALGFFVGSLISATFLSPVLGGWRNVFFLYGGVGALFALAWFLTHSASNELPSTEEASSSVSFGKGLWHVVQLKNIWLLSLAMLGISGAVQGLLGYLPLYLHDLGWSVINTGGVLASFHIASMLFVLPLTLWSDRLGSKRNILIGAAGLTAVGIGLLAVVTGGAIWAAVIMAGMVRDGFIAIFLTMVNETRGVGNAYSGVATGFVMIFMGLGNLVAPPAGNSFAAGGIAQAPLVFWAVLALLGGLCLFLAFRQTTAKKEIRIAQLQEL
jgi:ACS family hexuronate transporter-like MFS transporter